MKKSKRNPVILVFGVLALGVLLLAPNKLTLQSVIPDAPPPTVVTVNPMADVVKNPKLDGPLDSLVRTYMIQGADAARNLAFNSQLSYINDEIQVIVESSPASTALNSYAQTEVLKRQIQASGGTVELGYRAEVQCRADIPLIHALTQNPLVKFVRLPFVVVPTVTSEGVNSTKANLFQSATPYRGPGTGTKTCILDIGFTGYTGLLGVELPSTVTQRSFRADGRYDIDVHGKACAEIVYDMAPNAPLYLVNFNTDLEQHTAVDYLNNEGVKVVSYSLAWYNAGDGKGTGPICEDVKKFTDRGGVWASAAGNSALDHYEGTFADGNGNRFHNYTSADEILDWYVPAYTLTGVWLNWDDWGSWNSSSLSYSGSGNDYDMYLYYWWGGVWNYAASSTGYQTGSQRPVEAIAYWYANQPTYWGVAIYRYSTSSNRKLELFIEGNSNTVEYNVQDGSVLVPADAPTAVAVGAVDWSNDSRSPYHTYSSLGPTHDNRTKPDISAPSRVSTSTYGNMNNFAGTSPSTPHVAGAYALLKEKTPFTMDQIKQILAARAKNLGSANTYGVGSLRLKKD